MGVQTLLSVRAPTHAPRTRHSGGVASTLGRMVAVVALCAAGFGACTQSDPLEQADRRPSAPTPAEEDPAPPAGFALTVAEITVVGMDNAAIVGAAGATPSDEAAVGAVTGTREVLAAFLDAQLLAEATRFSAGPIEGLLSPAARAALTDADRAGLGQVTLPVARSVPGPASAQAQVLLLGDQVDAVTLTYEVAFTLVLDDDAHVPARQAGSMTFVPTDEGWRADAVEVTTDLPQP